MTTANGRTMGKITMRFPRGLFATVIVSAVLAALLGTLSDRASISAAMIGPPQEIVHHAAHIAEIYPPRLEAWPEPRPEPIAYGHDHSLYVAGLAAGVHGRIYGAGAIRGTYAFGDGVEAVGDAQDQAVVVAYGRDGTALWTRTVSVSAGGSSFASVAAGSDGTIYAAGARYGAGPADFGQEVRLEAATPGTTAVLAAYDPHGAVLWATSPRREAWNPWGFSFGRPLTGGALFAHTSFRAVAVDRAGNVYAAGSQSGGDLYHYGNEASVTATARGYNAVLVRYDASGTAQWARSICAGAGNSEFLSVAVDENGYVYAVGYQTGTGTLTYGTVVGAEGTCRGENAVLVKYAPDGTAVWVRIASGSSASRFTSVAVDSESAVYVGGSRIGTGTCEYGPRVRLTESSNRLSPVLVSYTPNGVARWARSATGSKLTMGFESVVVGAGGLVHAIGQQFGTDELVYGDRVCVAGNSECGNPVLLTYTSNGTALQATTMAGSCNGPAFGALAADGLGTIYLASHLWTDFVTYSDGSDPPEMRYISYSFRMVAAVPDW